MAIDVQHRTQEASAKSGRTALRSPVGVAVLSVVPLTTYGFWWWWALNRDLRAEGQDVHPWRALLAVTLGWVVVVPPFLSVSRTTAAIAAAQRRTGLEPSASRKTATRLAMIAFVGLALFATSIVFPAGFFLFGWVPIVFGMAFVWYEQREFNRTAGTKAQR